ncbi:MAG: 1-(5-phosphoribosyl)-5-amino-4-imidazole-carboxylate carboxylase [Chloroflexi bacterium HGW-Chloroflexi-3]|nr:MAG: 1-(5-phosphoribosyl)-5-amino-4-imidazole-carboxylate carboxylase [Chloroflexi bacterium HGW-Chloroflexi-3]
MNQQSLINLLQKVQNGHISIEEALQSLRNYPYENIGDVVRLDQQRALRCGFPEVIFGAGKSEEQLLAITERILSQESDLLITRLAENLAHKIVETFPQVKYHPIPQMLSWRSNPEPGKGRVLVLTGGTADIPVAEEAALTAEMMGASVTRIFDVGVAGLHRLLDKIDLLLSAKVLVVVAGMEGALPSVVAGLVSVPVIAVPTSVGYGASFNGLAALLAMLNSCANGVSVVNIDNGFGAGYQAALINRQSLISTGQHD